MQVSEFPASSRVCEHETRLEQDTRSSKETEAPEQAHLEPIKHVQKRDPASPAAFRVATSANTVHEVQLTTM